MSKLEVFKKKCSKCGQVYKILDFSDFEYGRRIIYTEDGQNFALVEAIEDENYKEIVGIVKYICQSKNLSEIEVLDCFDQIYGEISDTVNGKNLDAHNGIYVCPNCQSKEADIFDIDPAEYKTAEVPTVTYSKWVKKSESDKRETVARLLKEKDCC